ncbi:MAG: lysine exporter LysO family protein [Planctomycetes bacterium]|jgi:uncharacterized membrane protein YbjE (DUF340 family)|nr:lysine exporter LysO family protein [Planctomycetota bacterium]HON43764.1 lysine exporter LysO family protein [Planctomycetota bacterium]HPY74692.1 lysine exporter LysO family protein [Planctomycetota bacterium]HQB00275.1 lysine exporter LysO family protein [Planctomycetota bacterium]HRU51883.1 lysine exporter LysO family protein [Planctomycetota bacterium]
MLVIAIALIVGIFSGVFFRVDLIINQSSMLINIGLCLLLFFVGMDIGNNENIIKNLKRCGKRIWFLPICTIIGTLIGAIVATSLSNIDMRDGLAVSMGLGWASLSSIMLSKISVELGSFAFLTNLFREMIAIFSVPFIAKYIGSWESISVAGATAMDTLLPIINKNNASNIAVIAFFSGTVLSTSVPFIITFIMKIYS